MHITFALRRFLTFACVLLLIIPAASVRASGTVRYAIPGGVITGACTSWGTACHLGYALSIAVSGDQIWVRQGVHKPLIIIPGDPRASSFVLKNGVALYGGFAGTETALTQRNWTTNVTVLSGDIDNNDQTDANGVVTTAANIVGNNAYHVVRATSVLSSAVLDGFVITGGLANGASPDNSGGGMINLTNSNPTLRNIIFSGNAARDDGGGLYNGFGSAPSLTNVTFTGNRASFGGGMANIDNSNATLTNVTFSSNTANSDSGGMFNRNSNATLTNVTFSGNTANNSCGGVRNDNSNATLTNVTFSGNTAANNAGGGMCSIFGSSLMLTNVTFSGNTANNNGGGMFIRESNATLRNVIIWGNAASNGAGIFNENSTPTIAHSNVQGCGGASAWQSACGTNSGGNIDADPLFVNASAGNLRLQLGSPAINRGNNAFVPSGVTTDLDGQPRIVGGTVDMGAYEYQGIPRFVHLPLVVR